MTRKVGLVPGGGEKGEAIHGILCDVVGQIRPLGRKAPEAVRSRRCRLANVLPIQEASAFKPNIVRLGLRTTHEIHFFVS